MIRLRDRFYQMKFGFFLAGLILIAVLYLKFVAIKHEQKINISERQVMRILFVGNSYTFFNNMPAIISGLADNDPDAFFRIETQMITEPGAKLEALYKRPDIETVLASKQWDYVVLQPQSLWAAHFIRAFSTSFALDNWSKKIRQYGAKPVFFMPWPRQPGSEWYTSTDHASLLISPQSMYERTKKYTREYALKKNDMLIIPVGHYWMQALETHPELGIYYPDGSHPSAEGSFLTAMVFYKTLVNETLEDILLKPDYLSKKERQAILDVLSVPAPSDLK